MTTCKAGGFSRGIKIRGDKHTVTETINRQLAHYASHVGQVMFLGKMRKGTDWKSIAIPKGSSQQVNEEKFDRNNSI